MDLPIEDRLAIHELVGLHGHLFDGGELDRLDELFTDDVVYDVSALGYDALVGPDAIRAAALALGGGNPLGHHVTNVIVTGTADGAAQVRSKGLGVNADGTVGTVVYEDLVTRTDAGWRIGRRKVVPRRAPLRP